MFKLKENGTTVSTEIIAGLTTFFAMAYIIVVNPAILSQAGMEWGAVFLATIISAVIGTLIMGLVANVPYAQAPGMGLNAFFVYTVCFTLGFTWQQALSMVFICGLLNIFITVTKIRKSIIKSIPRGLQNAIGGGIGIFIAYIGFLNVGVINISGVVPALSVFNNPAIILMVIGLLLTIVLLLMKVKGAIVLGIILTTLIGIPLGVVDLATVDFTNNSLGTYFGEFQGVFGQAFNGLGSLFSDSSRYLQIFMMVFAFSLTDTFDTIGTFIGTGRKSGIFSDADIQNLENSKGFSSKMDRALFADAIGTSVGAILGTSNTTTYVESAAGIEAGGRTGLTAVTVAVCFLLSALLAPIVHLIPSAATSPALIIVGIMMMSSFTEIKWNELEEAIPAFFASVFMGLTYSISTGIAFGFFFYILVKATKGKLKETHPILWGSATLFLIDFVYNAYINWPK